MAVARVRPKPAPLTRIVRYTEEDGQRIRAAPPPIKRRPLTGEAWSSAGATTRTCWPGREGRLTAGATPTNN